MNRRIVGIVAAVILAAFGTLVLIGYVRTAERRALADEVVSEVYVVQAPVAKGTSVTDLGTSVALERVQEKVRAEDAVDRLDVLEGRVAAVDLVPGEQLLRARFIAPDALSAQSAVEVPDGLQQVSVLLEPQRALGGMINPGDTVAVMASFDPFDWEMPDGETGKTANTTHMILHKVLITQIQRPSGSDAAAPPTGTAGAAEDGEAEAPKAPQGDLLVTLALDAPSVEQVVFAAEHGFVWLSHDPDGTPEDGTEVRTRANIYEGAPE